MKLTYHQEILDLLIHSQKDLHKFERKQARETPCLSYDDQQRRRDIAQHRRWILHWKMFNHLLDKPCFSETNIRQFGALERSYGVALPASVREWYSLNFVPHLMAIRFQEKAAVTAPIKKLCPFAMRQWDQSQRHDLWEFMFYEFINQGGDQIAFKIDEGQDPPVFAESDEQISELSHTFSRFIFLFFGDWIADHAFKYQFRVTVAPPSKSATSLTLPQERGLSLDELRQLYTEQTDTLKIRFYGEDLQIYAHIYQGALSHAVFRARTLKKLVYHISNVWGKNAPVFRMSTDDQNSGVMLHQMRVNCLLKTLQTLNNWISAGDLATHFNCPVSEILSSLAPLLESQAVNAHFENKHGLPDSHHYRIALRLP